MKNTLENIAWRLHALADFFSCNCRFLGKLRWHISISIDRIAMKFHGF